jgi:periplasmic protein TonB
MRPGSQEERQSIDSAKPQTNAAQPGFLADCMVDADPNSNARAGRARGRAIGISAIAQALLLSLVLIVPLFATSNLVTVKNAVPIAPYGGRPPRGPEAKPHEATRPPAHTNHIITDPTLYVVRPAHSNKPHESGDESTRANSGPVEAPGIPGGCERCDPNTIGSGLIPGLPGGPQPTRPEPDKISSSKPTAISEVTALARLINRVEPVYPKIALYRHTEGTVELRAIIGRDGVIRDLRAISGDSILSLAALEAVNQWRFRPTMLNGQPVEVETLITVVFKIR